LPTVAADNEPIEQEDTLDTSDDNEFPDVLVPLPIEPPSTSDNQGNTDDLNTSFSLDQIHADETRALSIE